MIPGADITQLAFIALVGLTVAGVAVALLYPLMAPKSPTARIKGLEGGKQGSSHKQSALNRFLDGAKENRRKQVMESLKQVEEREKQRKAKATLRSLITQSGLEITVRMFWLFSIVSGAVFGAVTLITGMPWYAAALAGLVGTFGFPRWVLGVLRARRQAVFLNDFADAIDVIVRGLKAGLPVSDAMKIIAAETGPPVGPEFKEVVEGQRVGITLEQGIERMYERVPLAEVNFLAIVMSIQSKTGGNLSESLNNLSKVLRDRKKMKGKIKAVSQEAKSSAAIIGALPFLIGGIVTMTNPSYLDPLFNTNIGNIMLVGSAVWMLTGVLVMRKMINFQI
ncbi:type II secretion system F family protein [Aestuariivirga sp.]|uniref:type II secretion system F family protein n=1 Tax=Aestuariivirga sp. TaxID=2650926 RepID=UPI00391BD4FA